MSQMNDTFHTQVMVTGIQSDSLYLCGFAVSQHWFCPPFTNKNFLPTDLSMQLVYGYILAYGFFQEICMWNGYY